MCKNREMLNKIDATDGPESLAGIVMGNSNLNQDVLDYMSVSSFSISLLQCGNLLWSIMTLIYFGHHGRVLIYISITTTKIGTYFQIHH